MRLAVLTVASAARRAHLERQREVLAAVAPDTARVEVFLDDEVAPGIRDPEARTLHVPPGPHGLRVGAGRNAAAAAAIADGAELLVFLDVDCLPGPDLFARYADAARMHPAALLAGPVTYLASVQRPAVADLPFVKRLGGFHDGYEGYGAEDTDLAWTARTAGVPLVWTGGADAYHQWHPVSSPPWQHLDDILRNGAEFHRRWGVWPMGGWLDAFAAAGAIERRGAAWVRVPNA